MIVSRLVCGGSTRKCFFQHVRVCLEDRATGRGDGGKCQMLRKALRDVHRGRYGRCGRQCTRTVASTPGRREIRPRPKIARN